MMRVAERQKQRMFSFRSCKTHSDDDDDDDDDDERIQFVHTKTPHVVAYVDSEP